MTRKLLVTGASGQLGRLVVQHLLDTLNVSPDRIIATTRAPETLAHLALRGVEVRPADFDHPASLDTAFAGADRLLLISTASFEQRTAQHLAAIAAARKAGVRHVLYTSLPNPVDPTLAIVRDHAATEQALADSDLPGWTVLRNNWYFENLLLSLPDVLQSGQWFTAAEGAAVAYIARDDLARAAATALASDSQKKTTLTLGGARAYTVAELAEIFGKAFGRPIAVVPISVQDFEHGLTQHGLPPPLARILASAEVNVAAGRHAELTGHYQALTGTEPQSLQAWLTANKAAIPA